MAGAAGSVAAGAAARRASAPPAATIHLHTDHWAVSFGTGAPAQAYGYAPSVADELLRALDRGFVPAVLASVWGADGCPSVHYVDGRMLVEVWDYRVPFMALEDIVERRTCSVRRLWLRDTPAVRLAMACG